MPDVIPDTAEWPQDDRRAPSVDSADLPERIGRYRVERLLGKGGFGVVYLAHDEQLDRPVAVKVPHARLVPRVEDAEAYLAEARTVANLDHAHIVPVHDVGSTDEFACYVVSKYIDGVDLATTLKQNRLSLAESVELVATVAEALHYAHKQGLVHRDIKPGNILTDNQGKPFVVDFGLALRERDVGKGPRYAGTPAYMSPEQARGEGHRVDGRSDIFSLGAVLYQLLTGRTPFKGDTQTELLEQITTYDARPPRQYDDDIPKELERICLKALSKRATERYTTAKDLADELRDFLKATPSVTASSIPADPPSTDTATGETRDTTAAATPTSDSLLVRIVPKGLRSFDEHDADFFLDLLPGPRDREGLPDSIRFWMTRIGETDPDNTFSVGLIYGPSGCGKSSLVRAGLLPRLPEHVIAVYVEAAANETETRLLNGLRKRCPALADNLSLKDTVAALRRGQGVPAGKKVLIVLDQFEQWLHVPVEDKAGDLIPTLRQCDGGRVQCVVMVRDDFWMAATRFMRELEIRLLEGQNSNAVDLFPARHARRVLASFGRAFGDLPQGTQDSSDEQKRFLKQAIEGLADEGKVICVRLAMFAEMMKGRSWTTATLKKVGGTKGVGVTFLEETFSVSTAPPEHRYHQKAARAVLKALLPESGSDIKGHMRSYDQLRLASGYANRPKDFDDLLHILDSELRLITPVDPEGVEAMEEPTADPFVSPADRSPTATDASYYQLTHDYLVPSLREWLTGKQKETRRGRAELRLADRASLWNAKSENRHLPSLWEWANIRLLAGRKGWTEPQRRMMRKAGRYHALRGGLSMVIVAMIVAGGFFARARVVKEKNIQHADALVRRLLDAKTSEVPAVVAEIDDYRPWMGNRIEEAIDKAAPNSSQQLHASLALLHVDRSQLEFLNEQLLAADGDEFPVIRDFLEPFKNDLIDDLWRVIERNEDQQDSGRLRAACALAAYDPTDPRWEKTRADVALELVSVNPAFLGPWRAALQPVRKALIAPLCSIFHDVQRSEMQRTLTAAVLAHYALDDVTLICDLARYADARQLAALLPALQQQGADAIAQLEAKLDNMAVFAWRDPPLDPYWRAVDPSIVRKVEAAQGILAERFAFCQTMPLDEFLEVAEGLRESAYRPIRFRPYAVSETVQVAAVWTRDGRDWQINSGLTVDEIRRRDEALRAEEYVPVDVAGYVARGDEDPIERYAAVWGKKTNDKRDARIHAAISEIQFRNTVKGEDRPEARYTMEVGGEGWLDTLQSFLGVDGQRKYCVVIPLQVEMRSYEPKPVPACYELLLSEHGDGKTLWDVDVSQAPEVIGPVEYHRKRRDSLRKSLAEAEEKLQAEPDNLAHRYSRAFANFSLGNDENALDDYNVLIEKSYLENDCYRWRAVVHARLGHAEHAKNDLAEYKEKEPGIVGQYYYPATDAVVSAYLGEDTEGMKRLEDAIAREPVGAWGFSTAYALAAGLLADKDAEKSELYAGRAVAMCEEALKKRGSNWFFVFFKIAGGELRCAAPKRRLSAASRSHAIGHSLRGCMGS